MCIFHDLLQKIAFLNLKESEKEGAVFYPWGLFSAGYIFESPAGITNLKNFLLRMTGMAILYVCLTLFLQDSFVSFLLFWAYIFYYHYGAQKRVESVSKKSYGMIGMVWLIVAEIIFMTGAAASMAGVFYEGILQGVEEFSLMEGVFESLFFIWLSCIVGRSLFYARKQKIHDEKILR